MTQHFYHGKKGACEKGRLVVFVFIDWEKYVGNNLIG